MSLVFCLISGCNLPGSPNLPGLDSTQTPPQPGFTPLPTLAPSLTPSPTLQPIARIQSGDQAIFYGDWDRAIQEFQAIIDQSSDVELRNAALIGLGRTFYQNGEYGAALESLRLVVDITGYDNQRARAYFALGQVYDKLERHTEAAASFAQYLVLRPGFIDHYALKRQANSLVATREFTEAIRVYQLALAAPHLGEALNINIKIGDSYSLLGDFNTAIVVYEDVYNRTSNDFTKSQMAYYIGQAQVSLGRSEQAYTIWGEAVTNFPVSYYTYLGLVDLVNANAPVSELDRGIVDYYAGQYALALQAFDRFLAAFPDQHSDTIHFFRGLTQVELGNYQEAIIEFDEIILTHQGERFWVDAWDEKSYTQWLYLDQYAPAIQTLLDFVATSPTNNRAPEMLFFAGRIAERSTDLGTASQIWSRIGIDYPQSSYASEGFFQAGISRYRQSNYLEALDHFRSSLVVSNTSNDQARSHFWAAKALFAMGNSGEASLSLQVAIASDPTGYYSERAHDLQIGREPFTAPLYDLTYDIAAEHIEAQTWVRNAFALSPEIDLSGPGPLASDARFWRGSELWELGLYDEAKLEFESLRVDVAFDPANIFRLANYMLDLGLYRSAIISARQVLNLAGMDDAGTLKAPAYFNHVRFGFYYPDLIIPASQIYSFDPLFITSVMRQESLFEGFVSSGAGARGLMQIIPSTGQSIATRINWPANYTSDDLYRPFISVTLGVDYLSAQRNYFNSNLYAALAAYNGGPGNSATWLELAGDDQDLFLEIIRFGETRNYIRGIYELFAIYRNIYQNIP